jgi:hypothetical protein
MEQLKPETIEELEELKEESKEQPKLMLEPRMSALSPEEVAEQERLGLKVYTAEDLTPENITKGEYYLFRDERGLVALYQAVDRPEGI